MSVRARRWAATLAIAAGVCACAADQRQDGGEEARAGDAAAEPDTEVEREDAAAKAARSRAASWVYVKGGKALLGSPPDEPGRLEIETQHHVTLTTDFLIQPTETTQEQFEEVMGYNSSRFKSCGPTCPVEEVTWHEAAAYCNRLSELEELQLCYSCTGRGRAIKCQRNGFFKTLFECPGYRLPAEAEWELAARAGVQDATQLGTPSSDYLECESPNPWLDRVAWYCGNSGGRTHPVAQKEPNALGLYDMLGNVWEWNHDFDRIYPYHSFTDPWGPYTGLSRVGHGGSWLNKGRLVRFAARGGGTPNRGYGFLGFRPVRSCLGDGMEVICRADREATAAEPPAKRASRPADAGAEPDARPAKAPAKTRSDREPESPGDRRVSDNTKILIGVVVGVLLLFLVERLLRRRRSSRR